MDSTLRVVFTSVLFVEILFGITINWFIVIATWIEWRKHRQLHPSDQILLCLALSRSSLLLIVLVINFAITFFPQLQFHTREPLVMVRLFFVYCSIWFGTLFSVYYCVKITIYNNSLFVYIKTRISRLVPWLIVWSLLASLTSTLPVGFCVYTKENLASPNNTLDVFIKVTNFVNLVIIYNFASSPPFLLCCVFIVLLIRSIWFHTKTMQKSGNFQNLNLESHFRVLRGAACFIFLYVSYYIIVNLTTSGMVKHNSAWIILCSILTTASPVLHSAYLIFSISKLRRAFQSLFHFSGRSTQEVHLVNQE